MTKIDPHTMCVGDVGRALDLSTDRIKQLDDVLRPVRRGPQRVRRYDPAVIKRYADRRARKAA